MTWQRQVFHGRIVVPRNRVFAEDLEETWVPPCGEQVGHLEQHHHDILSYGGSRSGREVNKVAGAGLLLTGMIPGWRLNVQGFPRWVMLKVFPPMVRVPDLPPGSSHRGMASLIEPRFPVKGVSV